MNIFASLFFTLVLVSIAIIKKAMTIPAIILSSICSFSISYFGGFPCFLVLAITFILTELASCFHKKDNIKKSINEKTGKRDFVQILLNVLPGTLCIFLYYLTKKHIFLLGYVTIMGEVLADTLGSDIGILSNKKPFNIITLKKSEPGLSGNITFLGLVSQLLGCIVISSIYYIMINNNYKYMIIVIVSSFLGAILDSVIGASMQVKYKCNICKIITEKKVHCGVKTEKCSGISFVTNDIVNLICSLFSFLVCYLFLSFF